MRIGSVDFTTYIYIYIYIHIYFLFCSIKPSIQEWFLKKTDESVWRRHPNSLDGVFQVDSGYEKRVAKGAMDFQRHNTFVEKKQWLHQYHQKSISSDDMKFEIINIIRIGIGHRSIPSHSYQFGQLYSKCNPQMGMAQNSANSKNPKKMDASEKMPQLDRSGPKAVLFSHSHGPHSPRTPPPSPSCGAPRPHVPPWLRQFSMGCRAFLYGKNPQIMRIQWEYWEYIMECLVSSNTGNISWEVSQRQKSRPPCYMFGIQQNSKIRWSTPKGSSSRKIPMVEIPIGTGGSQSPCLMFGWSRLDAAPSEQDLATLRSHSFLYGGGMKKRWLWV